MEFLKRNGMGLAAIFCCCVLGVLLAEWAASGSAARKRCPDDPAGCC